MINKKYFSFLISIAIVATYYNCTFAIETTKTISTSPTTATVTTTTTTGASPTEAKEINTDDFCQEYCVDGDLCGSDCFEKPCTAGREIATNESCDDDSECDHPGVDANGVIRLCCCSPK